MADRPPMQALRLMNGYRGYQLVVAACKLRLPDLVAAGHADPKALAELTSTDEAALRRVLRGLVAWGFFVEDGKGGFRPTPVSDAFRADRPSLRNMTLMLGEEGYLVWPELAGVVKTGEPAFERVFGKSRWAMLAEDPDQAAKFNAAMVEATTRVAGAFAAAYDFNRIETVVDIGGGNGALLARVLTEHPSLRGILFDLPAGLDGAAAAMERAGVGERVEVLEGSFFESVPHGAGLYLLKSVIHDWDDERAVAILKTCCGAMSATSRVVLIERLLPERTDPEDGAFGTVMSDLHMMVVLGGRERTTVEYESLLGAAGLAMTRTIELGSEFYAIEAGRD